MVCESGHCSLIERERADDEDISKEAISHRLKTDLVISRVACANQQMEQKGNLRRRVADKVPFCLTCSPL